jgi:hypothetical protein
MPMGQPVQMFDHDKASYGPSDEMCAEKSVV